VIELAPGVFAPPDAVRLQFSRSGGPGGQNVNKLNTKAELWVTLDAIIGLQSDAHARLAKLAGNRLTAAGEIHFVAETSRRQEGNREAVLERLREMIVQAKVRPRPRRKTKPTRGSRERRIQSKRRRSEVKSTRRKSVED
jgi:ribosome-associated protein